MKKPEESTKTLPTVYADKVHGVGIGPFVSKIVLGNEDLESKESTPTVNIVMSTAALFEMCSKVFEVLSNKEVQEQLGSMNQDFISKLSMLNQE